MTAIAPVAAAPRTGAPRTGAARPRRTPRHPSIAGAAAAMISFAVGLSSTCVLVLVLWVLAPNSQGGAVSAWRAAGLVWLAMLQAPMEIGGRDLSLLPLGAVLPMVLILSRSGRWATRVVRKPSASETAAIVSAGSITFAAGAAGVAWLTASPGTSAVPLRAAVAAGLVAFVGLLWGVARGAALADGIRARVSDGMWRTWLAGLAVVVGLFAAGSALVSAALVVAFSDMLATARAVNPGLAGGLGLALIGAASLPTMSIWAMSIMAGPGVVFGAAGSLSSFGGELGKLPALPVLASLPAAIPTWARLLMVIPVLLGVLAGRIRWGRDLPTAGGVAASALGLGLVVAGLVGVLDVLAFGSLGGGRMLNVGPRILMTMGAAAGLSVLGFILEAAYQSLRLSWDLHRAQNRAARLSRQVASVSLSDPVVSPVEEPPPAPVAPKPFVDFWDEPVSTDEGSPATPATPATSATSATARQGGDSATLDVRNDAAIVVDVTDPS